MTIAESKPWSRKDSWDQVLHVKSEEAPFLSSQHRKRGINCKSTALPRPTKELRPQGKPLPQDRWTQGVTTHWSRSRPPRNQHGTKRSRSAGRVWGLKSPGSCFRGSRTFVSFTSRGSVKLSQWRLETIPIQQMEEEGPFWNMPRTSHSYQNVKNGKGLQPPAWDSCLLL